VILPANQHPDGLNELDLLNLDGTTGEPPESRLADVQSAISLYNTLRVADEMSSVNRSRIDAMFDGQPPYDPRVLVSTGQGSRTNLNFGEAQRYLDVSMSAFVDLYTSLERLVSVKFRPNTVEGPTEIQDIISEEVTNTLRNWPEFHSNFLRLCSEFTKHGVSVSYFDDPHDWRFRVCGLGEFLIPRQTVASEEAIEVACARRQYLLHELYAFIKDEAVAEKLGWDIDEVRRVIITNARTTGRNGSNTFADWETTERQMKNNALYTGIENTTVQVLHFWVREFDGTVSHFMCAEETPEVFMFSEIGLFESPEQAYVLFSYGVGTNGTYHSIRGLGHRIFNHIQTSNRLRCQMVDSAMMGGAVMIQPESQRALEDLSFTLYGPYSILSPNVKIIEKASPNLTSTMKPALEDLQGQLSQNVDLMSTYGTQSSPYRNQLQTEHDLAVSSRLSGSTINLFYASWSRLLREVTSRLVQSSSKDPRTKSFIARCAARGVDVRTLKLLDLTSTTAVQAIGAGSQANRLLALRELNQIAGSFDDVGRHNLIRDIVSTRVGHDLADRFVPANPQPRTTVDTKIALLENQTLQTGQPVPVLDTEMHGAHLQVHAPLLKQLISAIETGQGNLEQILPVAQSVYQHCADHLTYLANDRTAHAQVAGMNQLMQEAKEIIVNFGRKLDKAKRDQSQNPASGNQQPAPGSPSPVDLKMQEHQMKMNIAQQKAQQDMQIKQAKFQQEQAMRDATRASQMQGNGMG